MALPYIVGNLEPTNIFHKLRDGIPDPWLEYLAWTNVGGNKLEKMCWKDVRMSQDYQRFTDYIWKQKGLALVQGIPDPWKSDNHCLCDGINYKYKKNQSESNETDLESITDKAKDIKKSSKLDEVPKIEKETQCKSKKKLQNQEQFDRVQRKLLELESELKSKDNEKNYKIREIDKYLNSRQIDFTNRNKNIEPNRCPYTREKIICRKSLDSYPEGVKRKKKVKKRIKTIEVEANESKDSCVKKENKIPSIEKTNLDFKEQNIKKLSPCYKNCTQSVNRQAIAGNDNKSDSHDSLANNNCNSLSVKTNLRQSCDEQVIKKIDNRIQLTVRELNSPDLLIEPVRDFNDDSSDDQKYPIKNNITSNKRLNSELTNRISSTRDNLPNLFTRSCDVVKNEEDFNIISTKNSGCANQCNKRNCEKRCSNTKKMDDDLFIKSLSEEDD